MKLSSIKLSKILKLNRNHIENFNSSRKSLINDRNFKEQANQIYKKKVLVKQCQI